MDQRADYADPDLPPPWRVRDWVSVGLWIAAAEVLLLSLAMQFLPEVLFG